MTSITRSLTDEQADRIAALLRPYRDVMAQARKDSTAAASRRSA